MKTLLIADDEPFIRRLLSITLQGFHIIVADDGRTALDLARRHRPTLMLLDVAMPGMTGIEICQAAREDPALANTPIILLTANHWAKDQAIAAGATAFLEKPFRPMALMALVDKFLGRGVEALPKTG